MFSINLKISVIMRAHNWNWNQNYGQAQKAYRRKLLFIF